MTETKQTCAGKKISVKVHLYTSRKRCYIGINFQAEVDGDLRVINTAVNELHERATAVVLRKNIVSFLTELGILKKQIYSLMTDDGSNVL